MEGHMGMELTTEQRERAARIAPALRASLKKEERYPLIRFYAGANGGFLRDRGYRVVSGTEAEFADGCQDKEARAVELADLGLFIVAYSSAELNDMARACGLGAVEGEPRKLPEYKRLKGKIAIVTGSAQGFGEGIARELVKEGAHVVIADLNMPLARTVAASINEQYGADSALAIEVNVADEASAQAMVENCVLHYGGLDVFVNNAGVLRAGGLEELDLKSFEFVTRINYTAYFICTKYATRPMKIQNRIDPEAYCDVIQINSKSGLDGSKRNFAYAGGKFGGIGLTQSFAKELVDDRIKCNAVCPGNYYEGPLWSDPERGLFKQYLEAGKVEGAKTVEDVYRHYIRQVPMRKGCSPLDVARAIFYLIEQVNETGQALPVSGGQVMLN